MAIAVALLASVAVLLLLVVAVILYRGYVITKRIRRNRANGCIDTSSNAAAAAAVRTSSSAPIPTLIILGSGGHTTEILSMTQHLDSKQYELRYCKADTDVTSSDRLRTFLKGKDHHPIYLYSIPRSREVGQSYFSSIATTLKAFVGSFNLISDVQPQLILCNGPGTCIPLCFAARCIQLVRSSYDCQIVFCESFCRVTTLSLTGRILYGSTFLGADLFLVHWPELHAKYKASVLTTSFVSSN